MAQLGWVSATAGHRGALSNFVCTDPPRRAYDKHRGPHHPRPWELEVQSHLRGLRAPVVDGEALFLGFDTAGLAAAIHFGVDDTQSQFMIWAVACAERCKGQGFGRQAVTGALASMGVAKAQYGLASGVIAHIDPRNTGSRTLFARMGFEYLNQYYGYEAWVRDVEPRQVPPAPAP